MTGNFKFMDYDDRDFSTRRTSVARCYWEELEEYNYDSPFLSNQVSYENNND